MKHTITAFYSTKHTTGASLWDLDDLDIDPADIEEIDIKWDTLTIWFKNHDRESEEFDATYPVSVFDEDNGHEWIKHPKKIETTLDISVDI